MTVNIYDIGDGVDLFGDFSRDDEPADPTSVICKVRPPHAEPAEVPATKVGVIQGDDGQDYMRYEAQVVVDAAGDWYYRFEGTGTVQAAAEKRFRVRRSHF